MDNRERAEKQRQKAERMRQEDAAFVKVLYWLGGAVIMEFLLFIARGYYVDFEATASGVATADLIGKILVFAPPIALVLGVAGYVWSIRRQRGGARGILLWSASTFLLALSVCGWLVRRYQGSATALLVYLVPVAAVLALIYYLYQREFFTVALVCAVGILGLWLLFRDGVRSWRVYALLILLGLFVAAVTVFIRILQRGSGRLVFRGRSVELLTKDANYVLLYVTCGLTAVVLIAALALGAVISVAAYYAIPVAWALVMAVYYTVKLM